MEITIFHGECILRKKTQTKQTTQNNQTNIDTQTKKPQNYIFQVKSLFFL